MTQKLYACYHIIFVLLYNLIGLCMVEQSGSHIVVHLCDYFRTRSFICVIRSSGQSVCRSFANEINQVQVR